MGRSNEAKLSKTGNSLEGQKKKRKATPTIENEDLGQTSNWSKLVAAYLPVARLTILDRLVNLKKAKHRNNKPFVYCLRYYLAS